MIESVLLHRQLTGLVVVDYGSRRLVLCASVHIQTVPSLELLATEFTGNNFSHMCFNVVPHVLSDLTKLATDKALQLTTFCLSCEAFNFLIQPCCVPLRILELTYKVQKIIAIQVCP